MSGKIPHSFIDDILARTDIVDLIDSRVKLKKQGRDYQACCPFHHEKTPSFTVSPKKQFYHCFGCHAHGNAISFLMEYDKLEFVEAIEELASLHGLEVPREKSTLDEKTRVSFKTKRNLYELMQEIAKFYQEQLTQNIPAQNYLQQRGLSIEIIQRFQIGFSPQQSSFFIKKFATNREEIQKLFDVGMVNKRESGELFDRFRQRVTFPIRDRRGRVIAFGGRIITQSDNRPKYLNSPESVTYHKGYELYGLFEALQINDSPEMLVIVEGYMDVVALAQFGVDYAVASLGTATTTEQLQLAFRSTEQIICCYDGDRAGRDAAWRALENALPLLEDGRQLKFIFLPEKEDPDSFIRQYGKEGFEDYIHQAQSLSEFLFNTLSAKVDFSSTEGKAKLASLAIPLIQKVPGEMLRLSLRDMFGQKVGIFNPDKLDRLLSNQQQVEYKQKIPKTVKRTPMRVLIALLLQNTNLAKIVPDLSPLKVLQEPGLDLFEKIVILCRENVGIRAGQILEHWRDTEYSQALEILATWEHAVDDDKIEQEFRETLIHLYKQLVDKRIEELIGQERMVGLTNDEKIELAQLLSKKQEKK
ncbi:DNA primase [Histophilus somni]|uniref:DNA primase n=1 Tax=Histophilus somni TaxID=731 RepID=A0AAX2S187_HISSO|nr:DNA primase [Histophilus somni]ACA32515.1 DNA primase [Histophilus somni 2336]QEH08484.1 DNA primase [Histophilus somni]QEH12936.1 DNA primase [Histophilus somni]QEH17550.1 DNA primase [Histophilus somni]QEH24753.1 DNA primase [Histophilus somni]